ncbi:O-antigen ligase family protein [Apilactobacillus bombintestini]|uniref:O-antigen ligase family protein n=1 Tax=Apilactobacillus bombintestini TaxID=2419772 RepID=UPI0013C4BDDF|nr:O-antigen ligase family protein [Apilactobacillus bombintestini]
MKDHLNTAIKEKMMFFLIFVCSTILILQTDTVYIDHYQFLIKIFKFLFLLISLLSILLFIPKIKNDKKIRNFIIIFSLLVVIFLSINSYIYKFKVNSFLTFLFMPLIYILYFYFSELENNNHIFMKTIEKIIVFIACISMIFWILSNIGIPFNSSLSSEWGALPNQVRELPGYFYVHFVTQQSNLSSIHLIRNSSFFSEAPIYSYVLSIGLLIKLFVLECKKNDWEMYILLITILSTMSITGIIVAMLSLSYYYFVIYNINLLSTLKKRKGVYAFATIIILLFLVLYEKFIKSDHSPLSSPSIRADDFKAGFMTFIHHPLVGSGLDNTNAIVQNMNKDRYGFNIGISTGFIEALAYGGIYLISFYIVPTLMSFKCSKKTFGLGVFTFILFILTTVYSLYIYLVLLSYLFATYLKKENVHIELSSSWIRTVWSHLRLRSSQKG